MRIYFFSDRTSFLGGLIILKYSLKTREILNLCCFLSSGTYLANFLYSEPVRQPVVIKPREIILRNFTEEELKEFDGKNDETPIYICVKGKVSLNPAFTPVFTF